MDKITFIVLVLGSVVAGFIASRKKINIFRFAANTIFCFFAINTISVYFGIADTFLALTEDYKVFIIQMLSAGMMSLLLKNSIFDSDGEVFGIKNLTLSLVATVLGCISMLGMVIYKYMQFGNYSALFRAMMPGSVSISLGISLIITMLIAIASKAMKSELHDFKGLSLWIPISFGFTCSLYPFLETYFGNRGEFSIDISGAFVNVIVIYVLEVMAINLFALYFNEEQRVKVYALLFGILFSRYIQGMFLNGNLFVMDGNALDWRARLIIVNLLFWIAIIVINIILSIKVKEYIKIINYASLALLIIQVVGAVSLLIGINSGLQDDRSYDDYFSVEGIYEAACEDNIIVFVLDTYDVDFLKEALAAKSDMLSELDGFIYYPDMVSQYSRTTPSLIYMLTNKEWYFDMPPANYADMAFEECAFWRNAVENGFELYFYESDAWMIGDGTRKCAKNYVSQGNLMEKKYSLLGCAEAMRLVNGYRGLPYFYKTYFNYTSTTIEESVIDKMIWEKEPYVLDDAYFYSGLKDNNIDTNSEEKAIRVFHFNGAHAPFDLNANGERVKRVDNGQVDQCMGSMLMVTDYIAKLKEAGVYDKATIIITADHGENFVAEELAQPTNPILFLKPPFSNDKGYVTSDFYASQNDVMSTLANLYQLDSTGLTGVDLLGHNDKGRIRYHYYTVVKDSKQVKTRTYQVVGESSDFNNWIPTDEYMDIYYINGDER